MQQDTPCMHGMHACTHSQHYTILHHVPEMTQAPLLAEINRLSRLCPHPLKPPVAAYNLSSTGTLCVILRH
jgi:hypothetical protein